MTLFENALNSHIQHPILKRKKRKGSSYIYINKIQCRSVCVFHSGDFIFEAICKIFFYLLEQALGIVLVKSEFKYLK